ncbi:SDR family oxidoreductase [Sphingobium subterraneum]|uniref:NAD(P)-dependent dehydrogenase (Short-subunit alcohol dehydrogenase family) n=1 Tax=Sphingobium subterraneum TaxID=627688 RepID=A0A841IXG6_9SPHN|nr:SDR family oxidoreductase [Sphingobium subterraneum]MBB6122980.1 NAD(P)-dependent dehydrogenase (short-subunit alcohol dehydrogenase family) [Sphingobium subterraneum]
MDLGIAGQKVLITGASQGIGAGLAQVFAEEGCAVYLVARSADKLDAVASELRSALGAQVETLAIDLTAPDAVGRVVAFAGTPDILVNNAGAIPGGNLWHVDEAQWRAGWELKVFGYINMTRAFYPLMQERGSGVILNNIGNGGENFDFDYVCGTTGNAALMAFTRAIGGRSMDHGIRVLGVNPGPVATDRIFKVLRTRAIERFGTEDAADELTAGYPAGRIASVRETADMFAFLASPRSAYTSGTIITIDGGITSRRAIG